MVNLKKSRSIVFIMVVIMLIMTSCNNNVDDEITDENGLEGNTESVTEVVEDIKEDIKEDIVAKSDYYKAQNYEYEDTKLEEKYKDLVELGVVREGIVDFGGIVREDESIGMASALEGNNPKYTLGEKLPSGEDNGEEQIIWFLNHILNFTGYEGTREYNIIPQSEELGLIMDKDSEKYYSNLDYKTAIEILHRALHIPVKEQNNSVVEVLSDQVGKEIIMEKYSKELEGMNIADYIDLDATHELLEGYFVINKESDVANIINSVTSGLSERYTYIYDDNSYKVTPKEVNKITYYGPISEKSGYMRVEYLYNVENTTTSEKYISKGVIFIKEDGGRLTPHDTHIVRSQLAIVVLDKVEENYETSVSQKDKDTYVELKNKEGKVYVEIPHDNGSSRVRIIEAVGGSNE